MNAISLGDVWDDARRFFAREFQLVAPVALALQGLPTILVALLMPDMTKLPGTPGIGLRVLLLVLVIGTFHVLGTLAVSALALRPGASVSEALRRAGQRLPAAMGVIAILFGLGVVGTIAVAVVVGVIAELIGLGPSIVAGSGPPPALTALIVVLVVVPLLAIATRLTTLWPVVVDGADGPGGVVRAAWRQTRPVFWRLLPLLAGFAVVVQLVLLAITWSLGSVLLLFGSAGAAAELANIVLIAIRAAITVLASAFWAIFAARLYLRLAASSGT